VSSTQLAQVSNKINDGYRFGYNGQEKDDEIAGAGNHNTAEFWEYDTRLGRRWNLEPLIKKYPGLSSYSVFTNNPIFYADPDGADWVEGKDGGIKWNDNITAKNYQEKGVLGQGETYRGTSYERIQNWDNVKLSSGKTINNIVLEQYGTNKKMTYDEFSSASVFVNGAMREGNDKLGDITLKITATFASGAIRVMGGGFTGVAGGFGNGAPENGDYSVSNYQDRSPKGWYNKGMNKDGVGFSFNLNPQFNTGRTDLRIHPDGNNEGTLGCIGISGNASTLTVFCTNLRWILMRQPSVPLGISISGNPNNNGRSGKKLPNVNE
jgi:hypothetical protein